MINGILLMFIGNSLDFDHQKFAFDGILCRNWIQVGFSPTNMGNWIIHGK